MKKFLPLLAVMFCTTLLEANNRKFAYVYESSTLPPGAREIELSNAFRAGKNAFYRRLDQRIEFEFGVARNLMGAFYLNTEWTSEDSNGELPGGDLSSGAAASISTEWKWRLSDRTADPLGFALYTELTAGLTETEVEGKLIFDKQMGDLLGALNFVADHEWKTSLADGLLSTGNETGLEVNAGLAYSATAQLSFGLEGRLLGILEEGRVRHSALFAGPVVSYTTETWWVTLTFNPQVTSVAGPTKGSLDLEEYERTQTRLLFSFHV